MTFHEAKNNLILLGKKKGREEKKKKREERKKKDVLQRKQDTDIEETNIVNILQGKLEPFVKDGDNISI
jgi:hypothetical protein